MAAIDITEADLAALTRACDTAARAGGIQAVDTVAACLPFLRRATEALEQAQQKKDADDGDT